MARAAYRKELALEAGDNLAAVAHDPENGNIGVASQFNSGLEKDPLVLAVSAPPEEMPVGGRESLAGEDRLCGERTVTLKVVVENPGEKNRVPFFDPVLSDEDEEEDEDEGPGNGLAGMSPPYTARTDSTFASNMTGMTGATGMVSFAGTDITLEDAEGEEDHGSDSGESESEDSMDDSDSDDETNVKLPEKPAIILDVQLACKHPHSQQILDRQGQLLRSNAGPNPPLWLEALKMQHEKALKRKKEMHKRLVREREAKAEADALEAAKQKARNRFSLAKAAAARGEPIPRHSLVKAKVKTTVVVLGKKNAGAGEDGRAKGGDGGDDNDNGGSDDDEVLSEDDEDAEFGDSGAGMDCTTEDLAAVCFEFSCREGVKDSAAAAPAGGTVAASPNMASNTATQAAAAGMTASRGAASAAESVLPLANHTKTAGLSATEMLERLKDIAETLAALLQNPHVEDMYNDFAFHPDVRVTRSMGILCVRVSFSLRPEADLFHAIPRALGITKDVLFSSKLGSGVPGGGGGKTKEMSKGKYIGGGISSFEARVETNCDIFDGIRLTAPFVGHHTNMVRWDLPKSDGKKTHGLQSMMAAKLAASKFKKKAQKLVSTKETAQADAARKALEAMGGSGPGSGGATADAFSALADDAVAHDSGSVSMDDGGGMHHGLEFSPVLTFMGERMVECIFQRFDKDEDGVLSFGEVNALSACTGVPPFSYPSDYADVILEEDFDYKKCRLPPKKVLKKKPSPAHVAANTISSGKGRRGARVDYGIGLTLKGLKQAYAKGEGDLGRDVAVLGLGSLSHYLNVTVISKARFSSSLGRLLARPMAVAPVPGWFLGTGKSHWKQQLLGYAARLTKTLKPEYYYAEGFGAFLASLPWGLKVERAVRKKDGAALTRSVKQWLAWFFGHPGAVAQQVYSLRQNLETLTKRWRREAGIESRPTTSASSAQGGGRGSRPQSRNTKESKKKGKNSRPGTASTTVQEDLDEQEREAAMQDEMKAKQCAVKLRELCEGAVEELISVVLVSGSHSLRLTCSGVDVHRLFFDDMEAEAVRRKAVRALAKDELMEKMRKRKHGH
jgi:hypothetical protein